MSQRTSVQPVTVAMNIRRPRPTAVIQSQARRFHSLTHGHKLNTASVAFSPGGIRLTVAEGDGTVRLYVLPIEDLMALARTRVTRSLTDEKCRQHI